MGHGLARIIEQTAGLQRATTLVELVQTLQQSIETLTRYRTFWLALFEGERRVVRQVRVTPETTLPATLTLRECPTLELADDRMAHELIRTLQPVVVVDAREDERTTKAYVAANDNRTIINVPMLRGRTLLGSLGVGSFGAEGVRPPTDEELEVLRLLASQVGGALERISLLEERAHDALAARQLQQHLDALQRVELMSVLASGVAHDLNNCLAVVLSNLNTLDRPQLGRDDLEAIDDSVLAAKQAQQITQQLLSLGRVQAERREPIDLGERVQRTLKLVRSSLPHGVRVDCHVEPAPSVEGDAQQLEQVFANLLINARDAVGRTGTIEVRLGTRELDDAAARANRGAQPGRYACVTVRDDGCGIEPDVLPRIFDPLFSTKSGGTGLGLAVVARVVEQHRGFVRCDSTPGRGTLFEVYLPAR